MYLLFSHPLASKVLILTIGENKDNKPIQLYCTRILRRMAFHKLFRQEFSLTRDLKTGLIDLKRFQDLIDDAVVVALGRAKLLQKGNTAIKGTIQESVAVPSWKQKLANRNSNSDRKKPEPEVCKI